MKLEATKLRIKMCVYVCVSWQNVSLQFNCKDWTVWVSEVLLNLTLGSDVFCMCGQAGHSLVWAWHQTFLSNQPWLLYSNYPVNLQSDPGLTIYWGLNNSDSHSDHITLSFLQILQPDLGVILGLTFTIGDISTRPDWSWGNHQDPSINCSLKVREGQQIVIININ